MNEETLQEAVAALGERLLDREWRLRKLYWITDKQGRRVRFEPNWAQVELFDSLGHRNVDLKVRQLGVTTGYCMLWLDACLFNRDLRVGIVAHTKDDARILFRDKIKFAFENLPEELRRLIPAVKCDANELLLKNGSGIRVGVTFRSGTVQVLHVTEYGYVCTRNPQRAEEIRTGAFQAVPADGIIVVESTAKGRAGHFFQLCQEAQKSGARETAHSEDWRFTFLPWYRAPEYAAQGEGVEYAQETEYLDRLEETAQISLTGAQRQWWCRKRRELGDEMYSEYPSTPEEAFRQSTEGAYYGSLMMEAWKEGRITSVPVDKALLVDTWWDLGINDESFLGSLFDFGAKVIDKIFPDKTQAEQAKAALALAQQQGQLQEEQAAWDNAKAQLDVNRQEAANGSLFVAGWRPFIGWVCGSAFAWSFVLQPFAAFWVKVVDSGFDVRALPSLDTSSMMPVLLGMLGLGGLRTVEKIRGAAPGSHA